MFEKKNVQKIQIVTNDRMIDVIQYAEDAYYIESTNGELLLNDEVMDILRSSAYVNLSLVSRIERQKNKTRKKNRI